MSTQHVHLARLRTRWSAIGAAVAITLGAGGIGMAQAAIDSGDRPVTVSITSERILDTRTSLGLAGRFADATPRDLQVTGSVAVASGPDKTVVPADAIGVLVNVTVVTPTHDGFLSLRPEGATGEPTTSTVNFTPGSIEPNAATVDLNNGKVQIWVETSSDAGSADVLLDVVGYTIGHTHDDRYYTESETDAAIAAAVDKAAPMVLSARASGLTEGDPECIIGPVVPDHEKVATFNGGLYAEGAGQVSSRVQYSVDNGPWTDVSGAWYIPDEPPASDFGASPLVGHQDLAPGSSYRFSIDAANLGSGAGPAGCQLTAVIHHRASGAAMSSVEGEAAEQGDLAD